ncbi:hypothetical protein HJC23_012708 [Cyclotella cryptica]|uniref:Uncharacterized protein n=1 Tax=Cyclotella cryptica TaxID=29204 RepID=A0ABD3PML5_9STRA|eukprot:CCRYP_013358-RA/>CCRYP_013358-RA protein AED:0.37 eAED:0.37 QI:341/1/1/1/0/0/2/56/125
MAVKDTYSFAQVEAVRPIPPHVEGPPPVPLEMNDGGKPSDAAIMVGCGVIGILVGGPLLAIITALGGRWAADQNGPFAEFTLSVGRIAEASWKKTREEHLWCKLKSVIRSMFVKSNKCACDSCRH